MDIRLNPAPSPAPSPSPASADAQSVIKADDDESAALIRRLKWRSRRGTLELDLTLEKFWAEREGNLSAEEIERLSGILDGDDEEVARAFSPGGVFG